MMWEWLIVLAVVLVIAWAARQYWDQHIEDIEEDKL